MQDLLLQRYRIIEEAGAGGYARVLLAFDTVIQRRVAIKELCLEKTAAPESAEIPGLEEARTAALLQDPHIVGVLDFSVEADKAYLIMEYIDGVSLGVLLREDPLALSCNCLAAVLSQVASALSQAHENQVLHLDIKPDNILIDRKGCVKVADFGLAQLSSAQGFSQARGGTISYMPPEQMELKELDARTDEWALASLVYEVLSGENPFRARNLKQAQHVIKEAELLLPSLCRDNLEPEIDDIIFQALDPNPAERFESVQDFADALIPYLGSPVRGTRELAALVESACSDEGEPKPEPEKTSPHMRRPERLGLRLAAAFIALLLCTISQYALGFHTFETALLIAASCGIAVLSFFFIRMGMALSLAALSCALFFAQSFVLAFLLGAATLLYFIYYGRRSPEAALAPAFPALLGFAHLNIALPFVSGLVLRPQAAAAASFVGALVSLVLGACSAGEIFSWSFSILSGWDVSRFGELISVPLHQPLTYAYLVCAPAMAALISWGLEKRWRVVHLACIVAAAGMMLVGGFLAQLIASAGVIPAWDTPIVLQLAVSLVGACALVFFVHDPQDPSEESDQELVMDEDGEETCE